LAQLCNWLAAAGRDIAPVVPALQAATRVSEGWVRQNASLALAMRAVVGPTVDEAALDALFGAEDVSVRFGAFGVVSGGGRALGDEDAMIRRSALEALRTTRRGGQTITASDDVVLALARALPRSDAAADIASWLARLAWSDARLARTIEGALAPAADWLTA